MNKADDKIEDLINGARFSSEPPVLLGDVGEDDAFATESHPEGLRYGERPHPPGSVEHGDGLPKPPPAEHGEISIG
jgi:hypothetical protein